MKIYQIEISNECNLTCSYCPHPTQQRPRGLMSLGTFEKSLELLLRCGQRTAYLHNFGEPLLHPELVDFVGRCTERGVAASFFTNGVHLTGDVLAALARAGLRSLYLSEHTRGEAARVRGLIESGGFPIEVRDTFRPPVYVEFPDFGYGPASALLALVRGVADQFAWHLVSTGGAAAFVRRQLPVAAWHDVDTFDPAAWPAFLDIAPPGSLVISCTNPEFAAWAVRSGYRVGVVDTLDWMWPALPEDLAGAEFHLVQAYFGAPARHAIGREVVGPIVDPALWPANGTRPDGEAALLGFGGMHLPGQDDLVARYVRWFLAAALPVLVDHAGATRVAVVGGREDLPALIPEPWRSHPGIRVHVGLDRASYARLVRSAGHLVISPGLSSLYECAASAASAAATRLQHEHGPAAPHRGRHHWLPARRRMAVACRCSPRGRRNGGA